MEDYLDTTELKEVAETNLKLIVLNYVKIKGGKGNNEYGFFLKHNEVTKEINIHLIYSGKTGGVFTEQTTIPNMCKEIDDWMLEHDKTSR